MKSHQELGRQPELLPWWSTTFLLWAPLPPEQELQKFWLGRKRSSLPSKGVNDDWKGGTLQLGQIMCVFRKTKNPHSGVSRGAADNASSAGGTCAKSLLLPQGGGRQRCLSNCFCIGLRSALKNGSFVSPSV